MYYYNIEFLNDATRKHVMIESEIFIVAGDVITIIDKAYYVKRTQSKSLFVENTQLVNVQIV